MGLKWSGSRSAVQEANTAYQKLLRKNPNSGLAKSKSKKKKINRRDAAEEFLSKPKSKKHSKNNRTKKQLPTLASELDYAVRSLKFESYRDYRFSDFYKSIFRRAVARSSHKCDLCQANPGTDLFFNSLERQVLLGNRLQRVALLCDSCSNPLFQVRQGRLFDLRQANTYLLKSATTWFKTQLPWMPSPKVKVEPKPIVIEAPAPRSIEAEELLPVKRKIIYADYILSEAWNAKRREFYKRAGHKCTECQSTEKKLTCHHRHYNTLGDEAYEDIEVLCWECHKKRHPEKRALEEKVETNAT